MEHLDLTNFPGNSVVVDPPRLAAHRNPDRQAHLEARRREHYEGRLDQTPMPTRPPPRHVFTPVALNNHFTQHPLAERAGRDSKAPRAPWIQRLKSLDFLKPTGTASVIGAREAVRHRILREKNLEPSTINAVGGGSGPNGRVFGPPRYSNW
mmetsp:Transcript_1926/g.6372  ORF Transcript_1926/g.6372 Transcript_1926/m.6372 type:complete len:152 (+) Transcript_1926:336-791(+)|eukprot:scaffold15973_cov137-Isochrysis_galbana.AAC.12